MSIFLVTVLAACSPADNVLPPSVEPAPVDQQPSAIRQPAAATAARPDPQQQMQALLDCAALLAVDAGHLDAESETFALISYALGKAQELAMQAGLGKAAAKAWYDERTVAWFIAYSDAQEQQSALNRSRVADCKALLLQYEPNAQIRSTIDQARALAKPQPPAEQ